MGELVARETYRDEVSLWARKLRDPTDAPTVACAVQTEVEGIVTGDRDLMDLGEVGGIRVYRPGRSLLFSRRRTDLSCGGPYRRPPIP